MINEAILRSPKWLRNFADFEINTGKDIKGEPSLKRKKEIEEERKRKAEEERKRKAEEQKRKAEEQKRKAEEQKIIDDQAFDKYFMSVIKYIYSNYKICKISVPKYQYLKIEKDDLLFNENSNFKFSVLLNNTIAKPTFLVDIKIDTKVYSYNVSGLVYLTFKNFLLSTVYEYWKNIENSKNSRKSNWDPYSEEDYDKNFRSNEKGNDKKEPNRPQTYKENKKRRYDLLLNIKDNYTRKLDTIIQWEKQNPGKIHPEKNEIKIMIDNIKDKIKKMEDSHYFESLRYLKSYKLYENYNW